jgi:type III secretion protein R
MNGKIKLNYRMLIFCTVCIAAILPCAALGQDDASLSDLFAEESNPIVLVAVIIMLALAPFGLIMMSSFVKIVVVLSIVRNALGIQQVPPNQVITGIALILTGFIMSPVFGQMHEAALVSLNDPGHSLRPRMVNLIEAAKQAREPLRTFLRKNAKEADQVLFQDLARQIAARNGADPDAISNEEFRILVPSFMTSQLAEAFQIGFLILLPFLVVDMVVSNILQAMGMVMLSPVTISLPFKLLLFVSIDGWLLLIKGLVLSYS